jgi:mono/diheme cytochrome c family protein
LKNLKQLLPMIAIISIGCAGDGENANGDEPTPVLAAAGPTPAVYLPGEVLFNLNCAECHGVKATGTQQGPALVHTIYKPSHHADASFFRAAEFGAQAHHWGFGDMPPVEGISRADVSLVVNYVRWLQRQAGIN